MNLILDSTQYVFAPAGSGAGTITFSNTSFLIELSQIVKIINTVGERSEVYDDEKINFGGSMAGQVLTLESNTAGMNAGDDLQIDILLTEPQSVSLFGTGGGGPMVFAAIIQEAVTDVSTEVVPANVNRKGVIISNNNDKDCWIAFGDDPVAEENVRLKKNETLVMSNGLVTTQAINAICKAGQSTTLSYQEAT